MLVTQIRPVTRQKYRIEAEGLPPFVLYKGEVSRYHIEKDKELSMETYREILEEVLIKRAKLRTLHLLEQGDRTKKGLEKDCCRMAIRRKQWKRPLLMRNPFII